MRASSLQKSVPTWPRLGFLGVGWIGRHRMRALASSGLAEVVAVADPAPQCRNEALQIAPRAEPLESLEELLTRPLDGVVIATPSGLHAKQTMLALERGVAVFCQKPLARFCDEARQVVECARAHDRLLAVDFSYRHTEAMRRIRELVVTGSLGRIYAVDLVFHNAYGPDKPWFYERAAAGGGCVMDLGIHLVDLALWVLNFPLVRDVFSSVMARGTPASRNAELVEDYAAVQLELEGGVTVRLTCSWGAPAGREAIIEATFWGTAGGAAMRNQGGSFYDFIAERYHGTRTEVLCQAPDAWGGRALMSWAERLHTSHRFDPEVERVITVHEVIDAIYGRLLSARGDACAS